MKRINFNIKDRRLLTISLCLILVCIFTLTIAYAALNAVLTIQGNTEVVASTWNVYLDNVSVHGDSVESNSPSIVGPTTLTFSANLTTPGDFYEFTVDVINDGTIDAMINGITKTPELTNDQKKYLNYIVEYENGDSITTKQLVSKKSFVRLKVRVEFRKDITAAELPSSSEVLNSSFTINYLQVDNDGDVVADNGKYVDLEYPVGREICFNSECFYVISSSADTVTMLSKYNLNVGGIYDNGWTSYESVTGLQDSTMLGFQDWSSPMYGTTPFSEEWFGYSESIVEDYVSNYGKILKSDFGVIYDKIRLITKDELMNSDTFACNEYGPCSDKYPWIYSMAYWTKTSYIDEEDGYRYVWVIGQNELSECKNYFEYFGVRPVIVISKENL